MNRIVLIYLIFILFSPFLYASANGNSLSSLSDQTTLQLDLDTCIDIALKNNNFKKISALSVQIAEVQRKQALSSYWPNFLVNASMMRFDEEPDFVFTGSLYPGGYKMKLTDRDVKSATLNFLYPIYTGGMKDAIVRQSKIGVEISKEDARRTDLKIINDVKRMYFSSIFTQKLRGLGNDILEHFEAILTVTERFYKSGSLSVNKIDYLRLKTIVASIRAFISSFNSNSELAKAGLINTLGLSWDTQFIIKETEIPFHPLETDLVNLISNAYGFNPDWQKLNAGLRAMELIIREKNSGHLPKLVLTGRLFKLDSSFDGGLVSDANSDGYVVGLHVQFPLFNGFLTANKVREARLRLKKMEEQKILLKEGIAIQAKHAFILVRSASYRN